MKIRKIFNQPQTHKEQEVQPRSISRAELSVFVDQVLKKVQDNPEKAAKILTLWIQETAKKKSA